MFSYLKIGLDWADKFFKRFKALGYIIAVCVFIVYFVNNGCQQRQAEDLIEKVTGLNVRNDILLHANKQLDTALLRKDSLLLVKDFKIDSVSASEKEALRNASYWKRKHNNISEELIAITSDSSYQFTQKVYNYPGEKEYGYNASQVKGIHKTYLENENKVQQLEFVTAALFDCTNKYDLKESSMDLVKEKYAIKETQEDNLESINLNDKEIIEAYQKKLKNKKFWGKVKNGLVLVALGVGFALGSL